MTTEETIIQHLRTLSAEQQQEVLDFIIFLKQKYQPSEPSQHKPRRSSEGAWAGRGIHITEEDIAEARREMWGGYPPKKPEE